MTYIEPVRQDALDRALKHFDGADAMADDVIAVAQKFETYLRTGQPTPKVPDIHIEHTLGAQSTCRVSLDGHILFDGVSREPWAA